MPDLSDLRNAIDTLAGPRPDATDLHNRLLSEAVLTRPAVRRRVLVPLLAAAAVVALAIGGVVLANSRHRAASDQVGGASTVTPHWLFAVGRVAGFRVTRDWIDRQGTPRADVGQDAAVTATGTSLVSGLLSYDTVPGRIDTAGTSFTSEGVRYRFRGGGHVTRQGGLTPAQYARPWWAAQQDARGPQLSWHLADGSQFVLTGTFGFRPARYEYDDASARRTMLRIAQAVRTGVQDTVRMPFRAAGVPSGLVPVALRADAPDAREAQRSVAGADAVTYACLDFARPDNPGPRNFSASVLTVCRVDDPSAVGTVLPRRQVDGRVVRELHDGTAVVVAAGTGDGDIVPRTTLERVARRTDVSPVLRRPSTWSVVAG